MQEVRWKQRFENYKKAYNNLLIVLDSLKLNPDNLINKMATVQAYEMVFELGWKVMKDYLNENGVRANFPKEVIKEAFAFEVIDNGEIWMKMLEDRNKTAHTYDETYANAVVTDIKVNYFFELKQLYDYLTKQLLI